MSHGAPIRGDGNLDQIENKPDLRELKQVTLMRLFDELRGLGDRGVPNAKDAIQISGSCPLQLPILEWELLEAEGGSCSALQLLQGLTRSHYIDVCLAFSV